MENQTSNVVKEDTGNPYPLALQYFISHTWCIVVTIFSFTVGIFLAIVTPIPFFLLVPVISLALTFSKIFTILNSEFMEWFAKKHDYSYIYDGDMSTVHGTIFSVGQSQLITNVISKLDDKYVSRIFNYQYTVGSGNSTSTYKYIVFEATFDGLLPHLVANELPYEYINQPSKYFNSPVKINFQEVTPLNTFFMYAEQDYETEVYQIFTPEVIQKTMQWFSSEGEFSKFEFIDKKIYFFVEKEIDTLEQFNTLLLSLQQLIDIFLPGIKSVDAGVRAMNEVYDSVGSKESKNDNSS